MFRFTLRDLLWLMALIGLGLAWWIEQRKTNEAQAERDEAIALWHDASRKWVEATARLPPGRGSSGGIGGAAAPIAPPLKAAAAGGSLGGVALPPPETPTPNNGTTNP